MVKKKEGKNIGEAFGIIGLTLGILSIILIGSNGILISIVGFVFSYVQQQKHPTKIGKAGVVLNVIGFVLALIFIIVFIKYLSPLIQSQLQNFPAA